MRVDGRSCGVSLALAVALIAGGCASGGGDGLAFGDPGRESTAVTYRGPELWLVVDYEFAAQNLAEEWLLLDFHATGSSGASVSLERDAFFVITPAGRRIPLATQKEFGQAYGGLRAKLRRAQIVRNPLSYFPGGRRACSGGFFAAPGQGLAFDQFTVNSQLVCATMLFFAIPGAVQPGQYVLGIDLEETEVRIPFRL